MTCGQPNNSKRLPGFVLKSQDRHYSDSYLRSASMPSALASAAFIGGSTGLRSQMGMAVLLNGTPLAQLPASLHRRAVRPIAAVAALAELVADKLPSTPARTQARGLVPRIGLGGLSAALLARNAHIPTTTSAVVGAGTAVGTAFAGMAARGALAKRLPPIVAALIEDLVAVVLAVVALRLAPTAPVDGVAPGPPDAHPPTD
jgi:uncharacterized membrane protein